MANEAILNMSEASRLGIIEETLASRMTAHTRGPANSSRHAQRLAWTSQLVTMVHV